MLNRGWVGLFCLQLLLPIVQARDFAFTNMLSFERLAESQVSPDGKWIAFARREMSLEKNNSVNHIWLVATDGGEPRKLTNHEKGENRPRWSPDGKQIAFLSSRSGTAQIWSISLEGGEARQVTTLSTGADGHVWSRTGKYLAFISQVYPNLEGGDEAQKKKADEIENSGVKATVIDELLYRHWKDWRAGKRNHIFVVEAAGGTARDLTPGDFEAPPFSLGGPDDFSFSAKDEELAFTRGPIRPSGNSSGDYAAWSTDANVCVVPVAGGEIKVLTAQNTGWDGSPNWSPDGRFIAYRSQARNGYEADRFRLAILERKTGSVTYLAEDLDRSVEELIWSKNSDGFYFRVDDKGRSSVYQVSAKGGAARAVAMGINFEDLSMPSDQSFFAGETQSLVAPSEVAKLSLEGKVQKLTEVNETKLADLQMPAVENVQFPGANGTPIQAWLLKPPGFNPSKKHRFLLLIHGGPQSAWRDAFSYRWNAALFAAQGYVVLMPNPRGSTGFGQKFTEEISEDWPGKCYEDLMRGVDWAVAQTFVDGDRMAALGGSFGGYMVNWILGHNTRFKALVSHAGVYNLDSMYGGTEELWFAEWELGGTPWKNKGAYAKFSPHNFAAHFKTPTLVTHGELDFRVPISEGMQLFTALKRQGIPSRFLYYPDEGHWILKPKNSRLWYETVFAWLKEYLGNP